MTKEEFINSLLELNIKLTDKQIEQLEIYKKFLIEYNTRYRYRSWFSRYGIKNS